MNSSLNFVRWVIFLSLWMLPILQLSQAAAPSPVDCSPNTTHAACRVSNAYGSWPDRSICTVARVLYPSTEEQLVAAVAEGVRNQMKMRVVSRYSHSIPKLVCPGGDRGLLISTRDYTTTLAFNASSLTATVDSGVELRQFVDSIAALGVALPHSPYWDGVSIGGLLSTGAHGSSLWGRGSAVHEYVVGMRLVVPASPEEGYAKTIELTQADDDLNAAKVSLGVLGVISRVTFSLQPLFKRSVTNSFLSDASLEDNILSFARQNEFGDVTWYPSLGKAIYRLDNRVEVTTFGDGVNKFIGFQPTPAVVTVARRSIEELAEQTQNAQSKCGVAGEEVLALLAVGTGLNTDAFAFTGYPVTGFQNLIQTSGSCQNSAMHASNLPLVCPWDPRIKGIFYHQTAVSIEISKIASFIKDVKQIRDADPSSLCGVDLYNGLLMRYVKKSTAYLGKTEDIVDVDITYYRADDAATPRLKEDTLEEIEQMALIKYAGLPHWGKNRNVGFAGVAGKFPNLPKFLEVRRRLDPQGLFSSEWTDAVLGISSVGVSVVREKCALEGLCICSEDSHCAPDRHYYCRPGKVFTEARVCRYEEPSIYQ